MLLPKSVPPPKSLPREELEKLASMRAADMTDIVDRLREKRGVLDNRWPGPSELEAEAADEIERLRRLVPRGDALTVSDLQQMIDNRDYLLEEYRKLHLKGCICPPTSERTCQNQLCPRKPLKTEGM